MSKSNGPKVVKSNAAPAAPAPAVPEAKGEVKHRKSKTFKTKLLLGVENLGRRLAKLEAYAKAKQDTALEGVVAPLAATLATAKASFDTLAEDFKPFIRKPQQVSLLKHFVVGDVVKLNADGLAHPEVKVMGYTASNRWKIAVIFRGGTHDTAPLKARMDDVATGAMAVIQLTLLEKAEG